MASKRKLNTKTYEQNIEILKLMDEHLLVMKKEVALKFDVKSSTLSDMIKNKDKIMNAMQ